MEKGLIKAVFWGVAVFGVFGFALYAHAAISYPTQPNDVTVVYMQTAGCPDDQIPLADATSPTGWVCDDGRAIQLWTTVGGLNVWRPSGNVGIQTDSPTHALEVGDGSTVAGIAVPNGGICVDNDGACSAPTGGVRVGPGGIIGTDSSNNHVLILPTGLAHVGIGTSSPGARFDIEVPLSYGDPLIEAGYHVNDGVTPGDSSVAIGHYSDAEGLSSLALGYSASAAGDYSVALGYVQQANGDYSVALGNSATANGLVSIAMGNFSTANGNYATAMGYYTNSNGTYSTTAGAYSTASGVTSTAIGSSTVASGDYSTAMGAHSSASGFTSTAMGNDTSATNTNSTAMGSNTLASGYTSTASGYSTTASGYYSTALGLSTTAQPFGSTVLGRYNVISGSQTAWVDTDPLFVVGNGASSVSPRNALTVLKNGNVGIGSNDPKVRLHVGSNTTDYAGGDEVVISDAAPQIEFNDTNAKDYFLHVNQDRFYILPDDGSGAGWGSGGANRPFVVYGGYVGMGTATPTNKLHVVDNTSNAVIKVDHTSSFAGGAIFATSNASNLGYGVVGAANGPGGTGVSARALGSGGTGLAASGPADGSGYGVYSTNPSPNYFQGNVGVGGAALDPPVPLTVQVNGGGDPVGITQGLFAGLSAMELTTADSNGNQASRVVLRGNSSGADIEFLRGARGSETRSMFIEGTNGYVGIGTSSPGYNLDIIGGTRSTGNGSAILSTNNYGVSGYGSNAGGYFQDTDSTAYAYVGQSGRGIAGYGSFTGATFWNTSTADRWVDLAHSSYSIIARHDIYSYGTIYGTWGGPSDIRLKENITPYSGALDNVLTLNPITYEWKTDPRIGQRNDERVHIGLVAQEAERVLPELVTEDADGYKAIEYGSLSVVAVKAIQELKAEKDAEIAALKEALCELSPKSELCQR